MKLFLLFIFFTSQVLSAQQELNGTIVIDDYDGNIPAILIENITQKTQTISQDYTFNIKVEINDILKFSASNTEDREIIITKNVFDNKYLKVHLNRYIVYLKDTKALNLTGFLGEDIASVKKDKFDNLKNSLNVSISYWDMTEMKPTLNIKPMDGSIPMQVDFVAIFGLMTHLLKSKKPVTKKISSEKFKSLEEIKEYLGEKYFVEDLNIPLLEIDYFLQYTVNETGAFGAKNYLDIIKNLSDTAENYRNRDKKILIEN